MTNVSSSFGDPLSRQLEQQIEGEQMFRSLVENIDLVLWIRAAKTDRIEYVNPAYERLWGRTRESLYREPLSLFDSIHPEDRERVAEAMMAHREGGVDEEFRITTADGGMRWILARTFLIPGDKGEPSRIAGFAQDITEHKQPEEALRATLARMRERYIISRRIGAARTAEDVVNALKSLVPLAEASRASILVFDKPWDDVPPVRFSLLVDWCDDSSSPRLVEEDNLLEKHPFAGLFSREGAILVNDAQSDLRLPESVRRRMAEIKTRCILLFPLITSNQWYGMLNVHFRSTNRMDPDDIDYFEKLVNHAAAAIYNFHLLEAETRAHKEAEQANEVKLKFLAMISHELRTPLTSIKGFATTLLAEDVTWDAGSQRDFIETISREADKLTDLIDHLLDLSRLESGTLRIIPEDLPLSASLDKAEAQLQALTAQHHLEIILPEDLPPVRADPQRIAQVFTNLVNNASKYSPAETKITVSAMRKGNEIQVSVTDQGPGIPPQGRERVFEAFYQDLARAGGAERAKGAGLGLAICKGLVEAQGGRIWVQDRPGPGTTISFTLPVAGA